jgi:hypothetical protein
LIGNDPDHVRDADEHEQREHQREEFHAFRAGGALDHARDEFVTQFGHRLDAAGYQLPPGGAADHKQGDYCHRKKHVGRRTGERDFLSANVTDGEELGDLELMNWIGGHSLTPLSFLNSLDHDSECYLISIVRPLATCRPFLKMSVCRVRPEAIGGRPNQRF